MLVLDRLVPRRGMALAALGLTALTGCTTIEHISQGLRGHAAVLERARAIEDVLADPGVDEALKARLRQAQAWRGFASEVLLLPRNRSYTRYAEWPAPAVVWNVTATPALSFELKTWCYPVVGCAGYRGYFDKAQAQALGASLRQEGLDVRVYGVPAYSSLGYTADPLLSTFIRGDEDEVAGLVFHELAHQKVFAAGDTPFNESYATAVQVMGWEAWLATQPLERQQAQRETMARRDALRRGLDEWLDDTRRRLQALYAAPGLDEDKHRLKSEVMAAQRETWVRWRDGPGGGDRRYDAYVSQVNNATLAIRSAYQGELPAWRRVMAGCGGQWACFHDAAAGLARRPHAERWARLRGAWPE